MPSRRNVIGIIVGVTGLLVVAGAGGMVWSRLGNAIEPLQRGLAPIPKEADGVTSLREQVIRLNAENVVLRTRLSEYLAIKGEGGIPPEQAVVVRARVIARTHRAGRRYCEVDAGAVDGVVKGMPVCSGWSLVGVVAGVQDGRCLVQEVTDSESRIPAAIVDDQQKLAEGVLVGSGRAGQVSLDFVEHREGLTISEGMRVVSAGADGRLPAGLVLGTITSAKLAPGADHWQISLTPLRDTGNVESLLLMRFSPPSH
ncbi:MAG: rod shape-determining protein MreC [Planctomycetes bacterium]|nr:rod shape-determining protein MreC [Planctomycetota bacterium]